MDGFKDTTKVQYERGGPACYAKGGHVKGAAKVSKVMGEFKSGSLHSGSKKGPEVTNRKQAVAIALSEARKAGAKVPVKKATGGSVTDPKGAVARGNRVQAEEAAEDRVIDRRRPAKVSQSFRAAKTYSDPDAATEASEQSALSRKLSAPPRRGPAGAGYSSEPLLSRVASTLGLKKGGLAVMPRKG